MAKELIFRFKAESEVESLIDDLEEQIDIQKRLLGEEIGLNFWNIDRSLELRVIPKQKGKFFEIIVRTKTNELEELIKTIFGIPRKEKIIAASILDIAELIADLPERKTEREIREIVQERFGIPNEKFNRYKVLIMQQATRENSRSFIKRAADKFH
ncbi:MAG: hypothetical protein GF308_05050 [Candidatus Heimdallarchaeota archaeon]|nr:hypothetical protein [Candidatus Heimdallarchaeota archaeon]